MAISASRLHSHFQRVCIDFPVSNDGLVEVHSHFPTKQLLDETSVTCTRVMPLRSLVDTEFGRSLINVGLTVRQATLPKACILNNARAMVELCSEDEATVGTRHSARGSLRLSVMRGDVSIIDAVF